ncbi:bifunctional DNA primase/polymerase [Streptomyces violascens]|uniref:DNA primase n=1 Tax=Streptomyces violascens TaxID=67381 RepID=A0ABQ3QZD8_9ACTN|nr:bifunctional DNA primase/polymerase [Streptomyces violascens]GGU34286.1 DNA primase [Streptomyces violascens]GHI42637.1 DNA primase [Streptomyces violascens]
MGFTIGGSRGIRETRPGSWRRGRSARITRTSEVTAVAEYTGLWGWDVAPGARALNGECSCGSSSCTAPGAHPLDFAPEIPAGATLDEVTKAWSQCPGAAVLLPVGRTFDVLDVAAPAGRRALVRLERMGLPLGPVSTTPTGRTHFYVAPGASAELPGLLYRMGWDDAVLDLRCPPRGSYVPAPPSGEVRWLRPPSLDTATRPPQARLLLGTLAYICHRSAA